jgi:hypothetical protein
LIDWIILNRPRPLIFIGVEGLALQGNLFTCLILSGLLDLSRTQGAPVRLVRHTGVTVWRVGPATGARSELGTGQTSLRLGANFKCQHYDCIFHSGLLCLV